MVVGGVEVSDYNKGNKYKLRERERARERKTGRVHDGCWCRRKCEFTLKWITSLCILIRSVAVTPNLVHSKTEI